jgi:hypothetical protein
MVGSWQSQSANIGRNCLPWQPTLAARLLENGAKIESYTLIIMVVTSIKQFWDSQSCPKLDTDLLTRPTGKDWRYFCVVHLQDKVPKVLRYRGGSAGRVDATRWSKHRGLEHAREKRKWEAQVRSAIMLASWRLHLTAGRQGVYIIRWDFNDYFMFHVIFWHGKYP